MKHYILALVLAMASINAAIAANPIRALIPQHYNLTLFISS